MKKSSRNLAAWLPFIVGILFLMLAVSACKRSPTGPKETLPEQLAGTYVGNVALDGPATNVLIEFSQDTLMRWVGGIRYHGTITYFESIALDSLQDTVRFTYHRSDVAHTAWALIYSTGLEVHFAAPSGVPVFSANREDGGTNLTGAWAGLMSSTLAGGIRQATMTMNQQNQLFTGTLTTVLLVTTQFQINNGVASPPQFQLSGTAYMGTENTPCYLFGNYVTSDSIVGNWQLGSNGDVDQGTFALGRTFN